MDMTINNNDKPLNRLQYAGSETPVFPQGFPQQTESNNNIPSVQSQSVPNSAPQTSAEPINQVLQDMQNQSIPNQMPLQQQPMTTASVTGKPNAASVNKPNMTMIVAGILFAGLATGFAGMSYMYLQERAKTAGQESVLGTKEQREYTEIMSEIRGLVNLPEDEKINIARIDNPDTLKQQNPEFYMNAQVGHYLAVMPSSQRVLIYDRSAKKIVNFSSYSIRVELIPEKEIPETEKPLKIEIRATSFADAEKVKTLESALKSASKFYDVTQVKNSDVNKEFKGMQVVLLNRNAKPKLSQNIVAHIGSNNVVEKMPEGETPSTADVVVIVGKLN
ncbi:MAG: hypothetical protein QY314_02830 [Candidatus Dojkabacteria bacterium]|nr:MAG: hypothetical protein QY314_02830 [Candidatus Dojkabacteria bacterium]